PVTIADTIFENNQFTYVSGPAVPGTGAGSVGGIVNYNALRENQRCALTLSGGIVYVASSSHCDRGPYHGWVLGYDPQTLDLVSIFNDTPNGTQAGIWMSGAGPSVDTDGSLFLSTGNGPFAPDAGSYGETVLKFSTANGFSIADSFTPFNWAQLNSTD